MSITPLPTAPQRSDGPAVFADRADTFLAALPTFAIETEAARATMVADAASAAVNASSASGAAAAAGAIAWVSGTTYAIGDARYSPANLQTYRRKTEGAGTTDPSADATNWARLSLAAVEMVEFTSAGTWTKPASCEFVLVEVWAGGGGGGNHTGSNHASGGSGGQYLTKLFKASELSATESVVVGLGGAGGANGGINIGGAGGNSSFGSVVATGGRSGAWSAASSAFYYPGFSGDSTSAAAGAPARQELITTHRLGYGIAGAMATGYSDGGNCVHGGGGGGAAIQSSSAGVGGVSIHGGNGGAASIGAGVAAPAGGFPGGGGGGSANNGGGGAGGNGLVRVTAWG